MKQWNTTTISNGPLSTGMLEKMFKAIMSAKPKPIRCILSQARYRKCMTGNHEFINGICLYCWTEDNHND